MNESSKKKLQNLLISLQAEADPIALKLEEYHKEIYKLNQTIDSLSREVSEDEYVFSPRLNKGQNEETENYRKELQELKNQCGILEERYSKISTFMDDVVDIITSDVESSADFSGLTYQEQDRQRIARDLHDSALQNLAYLVTKLDTCAQNMDTDPIRAKMELSIAKQNLRDSIDDIKSIIFNLRPMLIDASGFKMALQKLVDLLNEDKRYLIESEIENVSCDNQLVLTSIYRIVEECFRNIKKHANAYRVKFLFQGQMGRYYIYIEDDGKGFDPLKIEINDKLHFGLNIVKERVGLLGGTIEIDSSINAGTRIKIYIPIA